jgi:shikimate dehydrogenase
MRCAVLGDPIAHSLSPVLHRAGYAALGLDWSYDAVRVPSGGLPAFLETLDDAWRGLSLTMPLKREAVGLASVVTDRARLAGAANTLVLRGPGLLADNTDIPGAVAAFRERYDGTVTAATVLGGGATATSTALALCDLGATSIRLLVRSPERAAETVEAIGRHASTPRVLVGELAADPVEGEVVVSTIPASAQADDLVARAMQAPVVFEVLYHPWPTPLAAAAEAEGRVLVGGLDLLVHQAAVQFGLFTGEDAPLAAMRAAGEAELARRSSG